MLKYLQVTIFSVIFFSTPLCIFQVILHNNDQQIGSRLTALGVGSAGAAGKVEGLSKKEKTHGEGQQCGDCWGFGVGGGRREYRRTTVREKILKSKK